MSLSCSLGGFIRGQNMLRLSEKVLSLCICSQKKEVYKKGWTCFSAYIRSLHPCVLQLQHQTFILTMNRLCLSMPVITSKLLGTGIIALLKQAGEEEKKKETKRIPWTPDCCVNNEQLWGKCWMYSFIFFWQTAYWFCEKQEKQEIQVRKVCQKGKIHKINLNSEKERWMKK